MRTQSSAWLSRDLPVPSSPIQSGPMTARRTSQEFEHALDVVAEVDADRRRIVVEEHDRLLVGGGSGRVLVVIFQPVEDAAGDPA